MVERRADPGLFRQYVEYLACEIGPRPWRDPALLGKTAQWIGNIFHSFGLRVGFQEFEFDGKLYLNVEAYSASQADRALSGDEGGRQAGAPAEGCLPSSPCLVVGAHYDTVWSTPGADDNASGIAGLLELARIFEGSFPEGLRLVAFCLEEPPTYRTRFMGSYQYAHALREMGAELTGMICLEMIAYFSDAPKSQSFPLPFMNRIYPSTGNFIALVGNLASRNWTMQVKDAFRAGTDLPVESLNAPFFVVGVDLSDHWSFNQMGYSAVMVTDTAFYRNPHYHRSTDRPETLDFIRGAKVVDGVAAAVDALCRG